MRTINVILDAAHGCSVPGKCSPDGSYFEYQGSRELIKILKPALEEAGFRVYETVKGLEEPGLTTRKNTANNFPKGSKQLNFLLSLHNNASGSDGKWHSASGYEIWTTKGQTVSDTIAQYLFQSIQASFPELKARADYSDGDPDKESNFTVLMGNYSAALLEWLFQDNEDDVKLLKSEEVNRKLVKALVLGLERADEYFNRKINQ